VQLEGDLGQYVDTGAAALLMGARSTNACGAFADQRLRCASSILTAAARAQEQDGRKRVQRGALALHVPGEVSAYRAISI
jgi:hypothetical protein